MLKAEHIFYSLFSLCIKGAAAASAAAKVKQELDTKEEYLTLLPHASVTVNRAHLFKQYAITSI